MIPDRSLILDEPAMKADGWVEIDDAKLTAALLHHSNGLGWAGSWTLGKLAMIVTCVPLEDRPFLIVSVSHKHGSKIRDVDRFLGYVREPHRDALQSYTHIVKGPAKAKWCGALAAPRIVQA